MRSFLIMIALLMPGTVMSADAVDYMRDIKPIFRQRCFACHGALKQEAGLRLDTAALMRQGGDSGPAIIPNKAQGSLLIERVTAEDEAERMPPDGEPLSAEQMTRLKRWINSGASAPEDEQPEEDPRKHWAFQRVVRPAVPRSRDAERRKLGADGTADTGNPIDAFLGARLQENGLKPQPTAPKHVLLRRVYLDLIGIPPTREELRTFLNDQSPDAYETVVDRLLNDPRHGQRWARHWMDIWRYSDWYGRRHVPDVWNSAPQIWRWRDWIVNSLNRDHGYDRMLQEMLAADEIAPEDTEAGYATGYLIRNWYALNPNDWMRNTVEHTGKAFLGLTFNCAHCHDHKYDPITQDDYFRLRAFFEPMYLRQDRVAGEPDPGPFEDYNYGKLRKVQRLGAVRIFDKNPDAPTWFYTGGDERNRVKERGSMSPGVPEFLSGWLPEVQPIELPARAWYPGLRPEIQHTVLTEARQALNEARAALIEAKKSHTQPSRTAIDRLAKAKAEYEDAVEETISSGNSGALVGKQSLLFDATTGRCVLHNRLRDLTSLENGFTLEFQLRILSDAHFNFQLARHVVKGLTAGYVAFERGRILSYRPGTFSVFETGRYDFAGGQTHFHVKLILQTQADRCLLTVRSLDDEKLLVDNVPIALNGWNPIGDPVKAILFDARTGSVAAVDELILTSPAAIGSTAGSEPVQVAHFGFEPPAYPDGRDVVGLGNWEAAAFSTAPANSMISTTLVNPQLRSLRQKVEAAERAVDMSSLPLRVAEANETLARAELTSVEARIAADRARYGESPDADAAELVRAASRAEREAALRKAEANVLVRQQALAKAEEEFKPAVDSQKDRPVDASAGQKGVDRKKIEAATKALAAARAELDKARKRLADPSLDETYTAFSPFYPRVSTGRRRALAEWITHRENPLTARVAVNHIWLRHFHSPLVASVNDFGRNGDRPTHPQLLDWLAAELMESGWSMKHLHRLIVTSAAYRRVSSTKGALHAVKVDPENKLLWRMNTGRMEAEVIRDSLLSCACKLDLKLGGQELENSESLKTYRRSLYYAVYPEQGGKSPLGELFDGPDALECYRRTRTVIPQQALALTNSELVHEVSTAIVRRWEENRAGKQQGNESGIEDDNQDADFVVAMFETVLSRRPTEVERHLCLAALRLEKSTKDAKIQARESVVRALLNHNDFVTIR